MSPENVEIVLRAMTALLERDVEGWVACCATDVEMLLPRNLIEGGSYKGHEGVRRAFADVFETWENIGFDLRDVREIEDRVVVLGRSTNVGRGEAPTVEYESAYLCQLREGKIIYLRPYESHREALEAAGLRE
jgi:ketosteroid isomerase-like protein